MCKQVWFVVLRREIPKSKKRGKFLLSAGSTLKPQNFGKFLVYTHVVPHQHLKERV